MSSTILREVGIERFADGQVPQNGAITDVASNVISANANRAYCIIELIVKPATGQAYLGIGSTAIDLKGSTLQLNVPRKIFSLDRISVICGTATETGTVAYQEFTYGIERTGTPV